MRLIRVKLSLNTYKLRGFTPIANIPIFSKLYYPKAIRVLGKNFFTSWSLNKYSLAANNKEFFLKNFGKQDFIFKSGYAYYAWSFKFPSGILLVFTGKRGTSYEYCGRSPTKKDSKELKNFFKMIMKWNSLWKK